VSIQVAGDLMSLLMPKPNRDVLALQMAAPRLIVSGEGGIDRSGAQRDSEFLAQGEAPAFRRRP